MLAKERRTRLIRFRVSPEEYESLSQFCASSGARSLSDLARSALQERMRSQTTAHEAGLIEELRKVDQTLREMSGQITELRLLLTEQAGGRGTR